MARQASTPKRKISQHNAQCSFPKAATSDKTPLVRICHCTTHTHTSPTIHCMPGLYLKWMYIIYSDRIMFNCKYATLLAAAAVNMDAIYVEPAYINWGDFIIKIAVGLNSEYTWFNIILPWSSLSSAMLRHVIWNYWKLMCTCSFRICLANILFSVIETSFAIKWTNLFHRYFFSISQFSLCALFKMHTYDMCTINIAVSFSILTGIISVFIFWYLNSTCSIEKRN